LGAWQHTAEGGRFFREQAAGRGLTELVRRKGDLWTTPREAVWKGWEESTVKLRQDRAGRPARKDGTHR